MELHAGNRDPGDGKSSSKEPSPFHCRTLYQLYVYQLMEAGEGGWGEIVTVYV
jgi:hypothetical protein